jgi:hypothetical protein
MIFMVCHQPKPEYPSKFRLITSSAKKGNSTMINITAKPTWQWSGKNTPTRSLGARPGTNTGASALKQALLPRSLDVDFSLKYRR